jgi:hypothetical protein
MKYAVVHFEYNLARVGNPYLFTVEGTPELLAEWKAHGGTTRETMTLAECEARGITLPIAIGTAATEAVKRADEAQAAKIAAEDIVAQLTQSVASLSAQLDTTNAALIAALASNEG